MDSLDNIELYIKHNGKAEERIPRGEELEISEPYYDQVTNKLYVGHSQTGNLDPVNGITKDSGSIGGFSIAEKTLSVNRGGSHFKLSSDDDYIFKLTDSSDKALAGLDWNGTLSGTYSIKGLNADSASKLTCGNRGSKTKPTYFKSGVPQPCDGWLPAEINGSADAPSGDDAKIYALTKSQLSGNKGKYLKVGSNGLDFGEAKVNINTFDSDKSSYNLLGVNTGDLYDTKGKLLLDRSANQWTLKMNGSVQASSFNATSDSRLKENIKPFESKGSILDIPLYNYTYIDDADLGQQIGIMAQDLIKIYPELVVIDNNGYMCVKESKIVYLLIDEIKHLKEEIQELKNG